MNVSIAQKRIDNLRAVYVYSDLNKKLTTGERICLTQERVSLLRFINNPDIGIRYRIPEHLEEKVQKLLTIIRETNWSKPVYKNFF